MPSFGPIPIGGLVQSQTASFWLRTLVPCGDSNCHAWGGIGAGWFLHLAPMSFCNLTSMLPHWCWLVPPVGNNGCRPYKADSSSSPTRATLVCSWLSFHGGRWCTISPSKLMVSPSSLQRSGTSSSLTWWLPRYILCFVWWGINDLCMYWRMRWFCMSNLFRDLLQVLLFRRFRMANLFGRFCMEKLFR